MKKKQREVLRRQEHRQRLREAKRRRQSGANLNRSRPQREERPNILIVCEGENTEPSYFSQFKLTNAQIIAVGEGKNTLSLVESVGRIRKQFDQEFDQVWCVFDKDDFPDPNFDNAIEKAKSLGYRVAYSNQAFEYWFLLHFEAHNGGPMPRTDYHKKLNDHLKDFRISYDKNSKKVLPEFFEVMLSLTGSQLEESNRPETLQDLAIKRAERILAYHSGETPANSESSTTVYKLVEELNRYL